MSDFKSRFSLLVIVLAAAIATSGCVANSKNDIQITDETPVSIQNDTEDKDKKASVENKSCEEIYKLFLENIVNVNIENSEYSLTQYIEKKGASGMKFEYAFFDINDDGINEFHLKSPRSYDIFTVNDGKIELWYEGSPYENFTSDGNILYCRYGGAPDNKKYIFKKLDSDGNVVSEVSWSVYEPNDRGSITSDSVFYNGDGVEITKDEYYELIRKYDKVIYDYNWFVFYENLRTTIRENIDKESETNITIQYPAFNDMENTHLQDRINANIEQAAFEPYYEMLELLGNYSRTTWPIGYTVEYMSDRYISVVFDGYVYTMGDAHGTDYKYAVTVDLTTGEKVNLSDVFNDDFVDYLTFENFGECIEIDFSGAFSEATDLIFTNIREEFERDRGNENYDYFHFADDGFHITHAPQNSYFCFTADYDSLKGCMKEHPIWEELGVQNNNDEDFTLTYNNFTINYDTTAEEITSYFPTSERGESPDNWVYIAGCPTAQRFALCYPSYESCEIKIICIENYETGRSFIERIVVNDADAVSVTGSKNINAYKTEFGENIYDFEQHIDSHESYAIDIYLKEACSEEISALPINREIRLIYTSGAGAWGDYICIQPDGSFVRNYGDSDMGDRDEEQYPNGTVYVDNATGKFGDFLKLDEYTYLLTVKEDIHEFEYEEKWIEDGFLYISTSPIINEVENRYILTLPGKPISEIPNDVMEWIMGGIKVGETTMRHHILYPYDGGIGYFEYD